MNQFNVGVYKGDTYRGQAIASGNGRHSTALLGYGLATSGIVAVIALCFGWMVDQPLDRSNEPARTQTTGLQASSPMKAP